MRKISYNGNYRGASGNVEIKDGGAYTFYNQKTGLWLSCEGRRVVLGRAPYKWTLDEVYENQFNVCAQDLSLMLDIDNAYVAEGTTVKVWEHTGYDVQIWNIHRNLNGTYSILYSADNRYCLGFSGGNAQLQLRSRGNGMQEWQVRFIENTVPKDYLKFVSRRSAIELRLSHDILNIIGSARLRQWANELETAYYSFYELTDFLPYKKIIVEAYKPSRYEGCAGWVIEKSNIIHIDNSFIRRDLQKMAARRCDWNFCALHEMGHMFDFYMPWNFEAELMTDFKAAYVMEKNNAAAAPAEFTADEVFYGKSIINAYHRLGSDFSAVYNVFGCTERFLKIKEDIGWEAIKYVFHYLKANEVRYKGFSKREKFENLVKLLSQCSRRDIKGYFSPQEWNAILEKCKE